MDDVKYRIAAAKVLSENAKAYNKSLKLITPQDASKKVRSYLLMVEDINRVIDACKILVERNVSESSDITVSDTALWYFIIVTYAKPFTKSKSNFSNLGNSCFENQDAHKETHEGLMDLRNKFIAHREESNNEFSHFFLSINKIGESPQELSYRVNARSKALPTTSEIERYLSLCNYLLTYLEEKVQKEALRLAKVMHEMQKSDIDKFLLCIVDGSYQPLAI